MAKKIFSCETNRAIPSGYDGLILPARAANEDTLFASSYPLAQPVIQSFLVADIREAFVGVCLVQI